MRATRWGSAGDHLFAALAVALATAIALPLELLLHSSNLVLVYVLSVILTGLKRGSWPAVTASLLSFASFNYFMTEPRLTLHVVRQDEIGALLFLLLIALICGPVASRVRQQLIWLREANRTSEAMRLLAQELCMADEPRAVWQSLARGLSISLEARCHVLPRGTGTAPADFSPDTDLSPLDQAALERARSHGVPTGRATDTVAGASWTFFPVVKDGQQLATVLIRPDTGAASLAAGDLELIHAMLQQAAHSWHRIQLAGELESARVKAEIEQLRSALLSSVSHDLKSPLAAMMGAAETLHLLDRQLNSEDRQELTETILQESRRLDSYIQNLLDMTRLGHGDLKIERDWVSVEDIIGSALGRLRRYFPSTRYEYRVLTPLPLIYVHAALIEQALFNILENAAKFSPADEPVLVTTHHRNMTCTIEIEDSGPGIPDAQREQIFDMFYVIAEGDTKRQNTGMGLAICRGMVGAHGGSVRATDRRDDRGTRFVVELPVEYPHADDGVQGLEDE